jgi:hypothetical protein
MKRGDVWTISSPSAAYMTVGQSGSSGHPITTTAYGTGLKPVIKIATDANYVVINGLGKSFITFDNLDIQGYGSGRSINYEKDGIAFGKDASSNIPHDWIITNCDIHNFPKTGIKGYDDAYNITIGNISATSCATTSVYSNQIYDCGYAGVILCGRNPSGSRSDMSVYGNYIHNIDYSATSIEDGIAIGFTSENINGSGPGYSTGWTNYCTAKYNYISNIPAGGGIDCHGGSYIYYQYNYIKDCRIGMMLQAADRVYAESAVMDHGYIDYNTVENTGATITGSNHAFTCVVAENVSKRATNCYVRNNTLFYTSRPSTESGAWGVLLYNDDGVTVDANNIYNGPTGGGYGIGNSSGGMVKNLTITNNTITHWGTGLLIQTDYVDGTITQTNNTITP